MDARKNERTSYLRDDGSLCLIVWVYPSASEWVCTWIRAYVRAYVDSCIREGIRGCAYVRAYVNRLTWGRTWIQEFVNPCISQRMNACAKKKRQGIESAPGKRTLCVKDIWLVFQSLYAPTTKLSLRAYSLHLSCYGFTLLQACDTRLGMDDRTISDAQIRASSDYSIKSSASAGRLNHVPGAWCARTASKNEWLQVRAPELRPSRSGAFVWPK